MRMGNATKSGIQSALKRKYLRCFGLRTTNTAALQEIVQRLNQQGVSRAMLVAWAVQKGFARRSVSCLLSRMFTALGLRERQAGAGRKASPEGEELLNIAYARYGEKCPKALRGALREWEKRFPISPVPEISPYCNLQLAGHPKVSEERTASDSV